MKTLNAIACAVLCACASVADSDLNLKWLSAGELPIEGRAFSATRTPFERLPSDAVGRVTPSVAHLMTHTSGLALHFRTDSTRVALEWDLAEKDLDSGNMARVGKSGFDLYQRGADGRWRFRRAFAPSAQKGNRAEYAWAGGTNAEFLVYFPLYNGVSRCRLGVDEKATCASAVRTEKPVVFYGVSTTQGASASRPGMSFPAIIGRRLDVPVVNLGFSGAGCMEMEMCDYLARIDARLYVIDTPGNMSLEMMQERYEKFIRELHRRRPGVPIVLAGEREYCSDAPKPNPKTEFLAALVTKLRAEKDGDWSLALVRTEDMFPCDVDETAVDSPGGHPSDFGMVQLADAYGAAVSRLLARADKTARAPGAFKIATFNMRGPFDGGELVWHRRLPRAVQIVRTHDFDLFGVQEVTPGELELLRTELPEFACVGCGRDEDRGGEGMYVFFKSERFDCLDSGTFWLSTTPDLPGSKYPGAGCPRTCTWALLADKRTGKRFRHFNTHLDHVSPQARIDGARVLFERGVQPAKARGETVLLTGDLNETLTRADAPDDVRTLTGEALAQAATNNPIAFVSTELVDAYAASETPHRGPHKTFHGFKGVPRCRIDYVFVTDDVRVLDHATIVDRPGGQFASDHYPVAATVEIR